MLEYEVDENKMINKLSQVINEKWNSKLMRCISVEYVSDDSTSISSLKKNLKKELKRYQCMRE